MQKIMIIGSGGAGKSTLARQLGEILRIEVVHLDARYWQPGWVEPDKAQWERVVERLVRSETWILDGNYGGTMDLRLAAADTIIFLDLPRTLCIWRAIQRRIRYAGKSRPDMAPGCPEAIDWTFLKWIWQYPASRRPGILRKLKAYAGTKRIIRLRSSAEARCFLHQVKDETGREEH